VLREVGRHGVSITLAARDAPGGAWKATYLPEIAQREGWSRRETMESLLRKAGFKGRVGEALLLSIVLTRYQSSKGSCTYADYVNAGAVEDAAHPEAVAEAAPALAVQRI
jgi:AMME syndrome candidate gene 1 protein